MDSDDASNIRHQIIELREKLEKLEYMTNKCMKFISEIENKIPKHIEDCIIKTGIVMQSNIGATLNNIISRQPQITKQITAPITPILSDTVANKVTQPVVANKVTQPVVANKVTQPAQTVVTQPVAAPKNLRSISIRDNPTNFKQVETALLEGRGHMNDPNENFKKITMGTVSFVCWFCADDFMKVFNITGSEFPELSIDYDSCKTKKLIKTRLETVLNNIDADKFIRWIRNMYNTIPQSDLDMA
jgi:hypothetical protein